MADLLTSNITWSLRDEEMGVLERTGLAGLHLSLSAAEEWAVLGNRNAIDLKKTLRWELHSNSVSLWWIGEESDAFSKLLEWSWQTKEGIFFLPGVHRTPDELDHPWLRLDVHNGMLQTFFQHNRVTPKEQPTTEIIPLDENSTYRVWFRRIVDHRCQMINLHAILRKGIHGSNMVPLPSWAYPGAAKRFGSVNKEETGWAGKPKVSFLLMFTPIACVYFELPSTKIKSPKGKTVSVPNWIFVVPEIGDLDTFSKEFHKIRISSAKDFLRVHAQGLGDAGLRIACAFASRKLEKRLQANNIYIVAMGQVNHYKGQNIRKRILELKPSSISIRRYTKLIACMPNTFTKYKHKLVSNPDPKEDQQATHWIEKPTGRGRIADNLVNNQYWYKDLLLPPIWQLDELEQQRKKLSDGISVERLWFTNLQREWREFMELIKEEVMWDDPEEEAFLSIFYGVMRRLLNKEEDGHSRGGSRTLLKRCEDRIEKTRRELMQAKTLILARKLIVELLAEAGWSKELTANKAYIWRLMNDPHQWKKVRDLALLALVTFTDKRLAKTDNNNKGGKGNE